MNKKLLIFFATTILATTQQSFCFRSYKEVLSDPQTSIAYPEMKEATTKKLIEVSLVEGFDNYYESFAKKYSTPETKAMEQELYESVVIAINAVEKNIFDTDTIEKAVKQYKKLIDTIVTNHKKTIDTVQFLTLALSRIIGIAHMEYQLICSKKQTSNTKKKEALLEKTLELLNTKTGEIFQTVFAQIIKKIQEEFSEFEALANQKK